MASVMCLHSSMHEEDVMKNIMSSVICAHCSQLVNHCVT